jgi:hypothetical protein
MTRRVLPFLVAGGIVAAGMLATATPALAETVSVHHTITTAALVPAAGKQKCTGDMDSSDHSVAVGCVSGPGTQYRVASGCRGAKDPDGSPAFGSWVAYGPSVSRVNCGSEKHTTGLGIQTR